MSQASPSCLSVRSAAAFVAALALSGVSGAAHAQNQSPSQPQPSPLAQGLFGDMRAQGAARYSTPDGAVRFVFDRSARSPVALVRFEGDPEVHVLRPVGGARGVEIYETEDRDVQLRVTAHGGITVYTRAHRTGAPVSEEARVAPLAPQPAPETTILARMREITNGFTRLGRPVTFEAPQQVQGSASGVVLDAAERAAEGLAAAPPGTQIRRVVITIGPAPGARVSGQSLTIQVAPQMGYAGRPSSAAIRNVVTGATQGPER